MRQYDHKKIEKKWQIIWEKKGIYRAENNKNKSKKPKFYGLIEFPYPSGAGMHVGHIRSNTAMDIISRKRRMEGYNVLYPIGWDAFGLPTENYAIKTGIHPIKVTKDNTNTFRKQLKALGFSFDWAREINTTDPKYYKWTQWIFLQFFKKGLAYKKKMMINWCPKDKIGLANEEVVDGCCERCGTSVEQKEKEQWMLAITKYADRLDKDLDTVDYLEKIKIQQRNWIGKSEGVNFKCKIKDLGIAVEMYNSVPQTFRAETFTVIAPEHKLVPTLVAGTKYEKPVVEFVEKLKQKRSRKDFDAEKEMEGIFTGRYIENFAGSGRDLPIWIASYVVADYGTGIVNASAHDTRDFVFAKKFNIPLHPVAEALFVSEKDPIQTDKPIVEREAISAIVKHWSEDKYLALKWKAVPWITFLTGGIEKGQTPEEAARFEIREETGFLNLRLIKTLPSTHSKFYHGQKKENRFAHFTNFYFQLENGEKVDINEIEGKAKHDVIWLKPDEIDKSLTPEGQKEDWNILQGNEKPIVKNGILTEPVEFKGREWGEVREDIINYIIKNGWGERKVNYKLRDWVFSRQRYWGEPIPLIDCDKCGWVPVPDKNLPVKLPNVKNYQPTDNGESPLANITKWMNVKCPKCKGKARRETDTMPNWAGSSWYYLRYIDTKNNKEFASKKNLDYWVKNGVDWYNGGMEHTTLHLLYSRFWHKFLYDLKLVPTSEPYMKRTSHGLILADDGTKFSKSKGNGIDPQDIVKIYGADSLRLYEMFMGPFDQAVSWNNDGMVGPRRFLERVWNLQYKINKNKKYDEFEIEKIIKKVTEDIESMKFNTAISSLMIFMNEISKREFISLDVYKKFLQILAPFAPHMTEELWSTLREKKSINLSDWPKWDKNLIKDEEIKIVVQVNGKVRTEMIIQAEGEENDIKNKALTDATILKYISGKDIKKVIYVKNRLINIVI